MRSIQITVSDKKEKHILLWTALKSSEIYVFVWGVVRHQINAGKSNNTIFFTTQIQSNVLIWTSQERRLFQRINCFDWWKKNIYIFNFLTKAWLKIWIVHAPNLWNVWQDLISAHKKIQLHTEQLNILHFKLLHSFIISICWCTRNEIALTFQRLCAYMPLILK